MLFIVRNTVVKLVMFLYKCVRLFALTSPVIDMSALESNCFVDSARLASLNIQYNEMARKRGIIYETKIEIPEPRPTCKSAR